MFIMNILTLFNFYDDILIMYYFILLLIYMLEDKINKYKSLMTPDQLIKYNKSIDNMTLYNRYKLSKHLVKRKSSKKEFIIDPCKENGTLRGLEKVLSVIEQSILDLTYRNGFGNEENLAGLTREEISGKGGKRGYGMTMKELNSRFDKLIKMYNDLQTPRIDIRKLKKYIIIRNRLLRKFKDKKKEIKARITLLKRNIRTPITISY